MGLVIKYFYMTYLLRSLFSLVTLLCIQSKDILGQSNNWRYTLLRRISNDEHLTKYICYGNKIVEFELSLRKLTKIELRQSIQTEVYLYDTITIKVIDIFKDTYIQISSFSENFKVINKGIYDTAPFNFKSTSKSLMDLDKKMKDTIIRNYQYKYDISSLKKENGSDSILTKFYFITGQKILSLFKRNGLDKVFKDKKVDLVGLEFKFVDANQDILFLITDLSPLDKATGLICEKILAKIK